MLQSALSLAQINDRETDTIVKFAHGANGIIDDIKDDIAVAAGRMTETESRVSFWIARRRLQSWPAPSLVKGRAIRCWTNGAQPAKAYAEGPCIRLSEDHPSYRRAARLPADLGGRREDEAVGIVYRFRTSPERDHALEVARSNMGWMVACPFDGRPWLPGDPAARYVTRRSTDTRWKLFLGNTMSRSCPEFDPGAVLQRNATSK
jgi:hypothetical protein